MGEKDKRRIEEAEREPSDEVNNIFLFCFYGIYSACQTKELPRCENSSEHI
jgi:hypothetical protein